MLKSVCGGIIFLKMKLTILNDPHINYYGPASRTDNYYSTTMSEMRQTLDLHIQEKSDYYIIAGDLFHKAEVHPIARNGVISLFNEYPYEKYCLIGNHDYDHNMNKISSSALGSLILADIVKIDPPPGIRFHHYYDDLIKDLKSGLLESYDEPIQILHTSIMLEECPGEHILAKDLKLNPKTKYVVSGHIHTPMLAKFDTWTFLNVGSLGRNTAGKEHWRLPRVLFLSEDSYYTKTLDTLKHTEIFDLGQRSKVKSEKDRASKYISSLYKSWKNIDQKDLRESGEKRKLEKEVIDKAVSALENI